MLMIAICEDEIYMLNDLKTRINRYIKQHKLHAQVFCFTSGVQLLQSNDFFNILIMDVRMEGINGMETIRRLRLMGKNSQTVFVTSSKDHVFQAFDVDAVHYLLKPVSDRDLFHALDKAIKRSGLMDTQTITITKGSTVQIINIRDILFCEVLNHKIFIHTPTGVVDYYNKLDSLQKQLDNRFFRCHRSFIVNMNYVQSKEQDQAVLTNGERVFVSRRNLQEFNRKLLTLIRNEVL